MVKVLGIIPARFGSTRFPGKPLAMIAGKSLIERTYMNAKGCPIFDQVVVATDESSIFNHVNSFGGMAVMTSTKCPTGSERLVEVIRSGKYNEYDVVVNIQGDEPCIEPHVIKDVVNALSDSVAVVSTALVKLEEQDAFNPSVVKCVRDENGYALYFSRSLIPGNKENKWDSKITYYRHLGIYAYKRDFLLKFAELTPTPLQLAEDLEQLKVLENGYKIITSVVQSNAFGVDTPEDIKKIERLL